MNLKEFLDLLFKSFNEEIEPTTEQLQNCRNFLDNFKADNKTAEDIEKQMQAIADKAAESKNAELVAVVNEMRAKITELSNNKLNQQTMENKEKIYASEKYLNDFLNALRKENATFKGAREEAAIANGLQVSEALFPVTIMQGVEDNISREESFIPYLRYVQGYFVEIPTAILSDAEGERAGAHKDLAQKASQNPQITDKAISTAEIYKLLSIPYSTRKKWDNATLMAWVINELSQMITNEIERVIIVGDGREDRSERKIKSFETLAAEDADPNYIKSVVAAEGDVVNLEVVHDLVDEIEADGDVFLVIEKKTWSKLKKRVFAAGGTTDYLSDQEVMDKLGVAKVFLRKWMTSANGALVAAFTPAHYLIAGERAPEKIEAYDIKVNAHEIEMVGLFGGALAKVHSAAVLKPHAVLAAAAEAKAAPKKA